MDMPNNRLGEIAADCLRVLLKPIIRFCIRRSIGFQLFNEIVKELFIILASEELSSTHAAPKTSRLAIMTGINRREVDRLKQGKKKLNPTHNVATKVIGQWQNDRRFVSKSGNTKKLLLESGQGDFAELIATVSRELNPYTVLREFERLKIVSRDGQYIKLNTNEYVANENILDGCNMVASDIEDLLSAAENNIENKSEVPHLHLSTRYDNICPEYLDKIKHWFISEGAELHRRARDYISQFDKDLNPKLFDKKGGGKVTFGTFSYAEKIEEKVKV